MPPEVVQERQFPELAPLAVSKQLVQIPIVEAESDEIKQEKQPDDNVDESNDAPEYDDRAFPEDFSEDEFTAENNAGRTIFDHLGRGILKRERGLGRLKLRSKQAAIHHSFMVMRMEDLEEEVRELKIALFKLDKDFDAPENEQKIPTHKHEIRRLGINDFRIDREIVMLPEKQQPALEVQYSRGPNGMMGQVDEAPERLRIRSRALLGHLENLSGKEVPFDLGTYELDGKKLHQALVFLRPFKFFVKQDAAIRKSLEDLELELQNETQPEAKDDKEGVEKRKKGASDKNLYEDLKLLIEFLDDDLKPTFTLRQQIKDGTATEIEYADLWHLFERGEIVVTPNNPAHAHLVVNVAGGRDPLTKKLIEEEEVNFAPVDGFVVDCLSISTNGSLYVPKLEKITIRKFHGRRSIQSLQAYPLRFDPNAAILKARFAETGRKFLEVTRNPFCHMMAKGKTVDEPSYDVENQVIIDMTLAMAANPDWQTNTTISEGELTKRDERETWQEPWCKHSIRNEGCCGSDRIFKDLIPDGLDTEAFIRSMSGVMGPRRGEELSEDELVLIRPCVHAYVLRSRQWVTVQIEDLHPVVFENSFKDLLLPDSHKKTVQALVKTHENTRTAAAPSIESSSIGASLDLVKGKGRGLIILLHGPPGVGKTSTAECVADDTGRPLYPITCGDIGETAAEVESNLQYNFQLAHKWGCVLLLDEADIFLAKRNRTDLRHNAVTSVFLRSLEYYAGILFLTTNRVGAIDPAFKSRIQISLFYPRLDLPTTMKLYAKFIQRARDAQERKQNFSFKIKDKQILSFAEKHFHQLEAANRETWNGRSVSFHSVHVILFPLHHP